METDMQYILDVMSELEEDYSVSRNVKSRMAVMRDELCKCSNEERSLKINKILSEMEDICNDVNVPAFVRTQIFHLTSMLETMA